jgi:L-cysteine desulfidase
MDAVQYGRYREILKAELLMAQGCTEPAAVAYAAAKAREILGCFPERVELSCSGNVLKNVMGVTIPRSGGRRGLETAAILGVLGGNSQRALEVLDSVQPAHIAELDALLAKGYCRCTVSKTTEKLFISATVFSGSHWAQVDIARAHTNIVKMVKDGEVLLSCNLEAEQGPTDRSFLNLEDIFTYAETEDLSILHALLENQIRRNFAIAQEGLTHPYGAQVGRTIWNSRQEDAAAWACAAAAAASDARMGGCSLPVVMNSGSGNQGIAASVPIIAYAQKLHSADDTLYRALAISNLVTILQKRYIGPLSAYCGVVCAACGAGAGITYLRGGTREEIEMTITNTLGTISGMVCDGAKSSCAAKIAAAVNTAILSGEMSLQHRCLQPGEGIVCENAEATIRNVGILGREGMRVTDEVILRLMLEHAGDSPNREKSLPNRKAGRETADSGERNKIL